MTPGDADWCVLAALASVVLARVINAVPEGRRSGADCGSWGCGSEVRLGHPPQGSADQARHPLEGEAQDSPMRPGARQVQHDPGLQRDDAGGEFDQAQAEGVELRHALA